MRHTLLHSRTTIFWPLWPQKWPPKSSWGDSSHLTAVRFLLWMLTPQPSRPESHPLNTLWKFWRTMQSDKMKDESRLSMEQLTRQYLLIAASCTAGHTHIWYQPLLPGSFEQSMPGITEVKASPTILLQMYGAVWLIFVQDSWSA